MTNSKNIVIIALVLIIVILVGWTAYTLIITAPKKAEAACKASIETQVIPQLKAAAEKECAAVTEAQVMSAVQQCQQTLQQLMQVPACVAALPQ